MATVDPIEGFKPKRRRVSQGDATQLPWVSPRKMEADLAMYEATTDARAQRVAASMASVAPEAASARAYARQKRDEFIASSPHAPRPACERSERAGLGLVFNATKKTRVDVAGFRRPPREKFEIHREAQRCKRMKTSVGHVARLLHFEAHGEREAQRWNKKFITLTYRNADDWSPNHIRSFVQVLYKWCLRNRVRARYVWVAELQARGALHYHMVLWLPKGKFMPTPDKQGWWPHGSTNVVTAHNPVAYIAKYASKTTGAQALGYPKGARMHGFGGLTGESKRHVRYWMAPMWVRDALSGRADIRKVSGGYMDKFSGEFLPSPWRVMVGPGGQVWAYRIDESETVQ